MSETTASGTGEMHLGWTGDMVCIGAGPMRLRFSEAEATRLMYGLRAMLTGESEESCGCEAEPRTVMYAEYDPGGVREALRESIQEARRAFREA